MNESDKQEFGVIDGGTAFPYITGGMSLREWFAGLAMQGFIQTDLPTAVIAEQSYKLADAMLLEKQTREKGEKRDGSKD